MIDESPSGLPLPRLQLTWEHIGGDEWRVRYELIIPVGRHDIRAEANADSSDLKGYITAPLSRGTTVTSSRNPIERDGVLSAPFRDGAHAQWDSIALGIPAFVVYKDVYRRIGGDPQTWQNPPPHGLKERS